MCPRKSLWREISKILTDQFLSWFVGRMRLAGEQDLHRSVRVLQNRPQPVEIAEQEVGPFVGGEPAREPDGQRFGVEKLVHFAQFVGRTAVAGELGANACAGEPDQALLLHVVDVPQFLVGDVGHVAFPEQIIQQILAPGGREILVEQIRHLESEPRLGVHAVGDGLDRLLAR